MTQSILNSLIALISRYKYLLMSLIAALPLYMAINAYVNAIDVHEDEAVSSAATMSFFAGVFAGRYMAQYWTSKVKSLGDLYTIAPAILIVASTSWLFFHADFPLQGRAAINLLLFWLPFILLSLSIGILIKTVRAVTQARLQEAEQSAAHSKSELHLLQSQLSPHFLFNTLNNMYGLSISQPEKIPPLILKLSELLRYSVYEANEIFVPLKHELAYINNYIDFEKIRMGNRLVLTTKLEAITSEDIKIAPMLLIVFIENAFKHGRNTIDQKVYIDIDLKTWGQEILFSVKNSYSESKDVNIEKFNQHSGFGLPSVVRRLDLLYPKEHELYQQTENGFYTVLLRLKKK